MSKREQEKADKKQQREEQERIKRIERIEKEEQKLQKEEQPKPQKEEQPQPPTPTAKGWKKGATPQIQEQSPKSPHRFWSIGIDGGCAYQKAIALF